MDFGKAQVIPDLKMENSNFEASPGEHFAQSVGDLFKLANTNKLPLFQGQDKLTLKNVNDNPNLSSDEKYKLTEQFKHFFMFILLAN